MLLLTLILGIATSIHGWSYVLMEDGPLVDKSDYAIVGLVQRELHHLEFSKKSLETLNMVSRRYEVCTY